MSPPATVNSYRSSTTPPGKIAFEPIPHEPRVSTAELHAEQRPRKGVFGARLHQPLADLLGADPVLICGTHVARERGELRQPMSANDKHSHTDSPPTTPPRTTRGDSQSGCR